MAAVNENITIPMVANGVFLTDVNGMPYTIYNNNVTTFVPIISGSVTSPTSITYATQAGFYIKIGNLVFYSINILLSAVTLGPASGALLISSLPTSLNTANLIWPGSVSINNVTTTASVISLCSYMTPNANYIVIVESFDTNPAANLSITSLNATSGFNISGFYLAA